MRGTVGRARRRLIAVLFLSAVMVLALIMLVMMMPGVVAGRLLGSVRMLVRATAGAVSHGIVR